MIKIPQYIIETIIRQANSELPNEACGLLTGTEDAIKKQYPLTNTDHSPEHFSFDPREQFQVLKEARTEGQKIIANYHSHPYTPACPSKEDIRLAFDANIIYMIVSLAEKYPVIKAFSIVNGSVFPIEIMIVN